MSTGYTRIVEALEEGRRALARARFTAGSLRFLGMALATLAGLVLWAVLQKTLRVHSVPLAWAASVLGGGLVVFALVRWLVVPLIRLPDRDDFVRMIERRFPAEKNVIVNAYQLGDSARTSQGEKAPDLVDALVSRAADRIQGLDLKRWRDPAPDRPFLWAGGAALAFVTLLAVLSPALLAGALGQIVRPSLAKAPPVGIQVEPGDVSVERGNDVAVLARIEGSGEAPVLHFRERHGTWRTRDFHEDGDVTRDGGLWQAELSEVDRQLEYRVSAGRSESDVFTVEVLEPLRLVGFRAHLVYPEYSGLPNETLSSGAGDLAALRGTEVDLRVLTNRPLTSAVIEWHEDGASAPSNLPLERVDETTWRAGFRMMTPANYSVVAKDEAGVDRLRTPRYRVSPTEDRAPHLTLHFPQEDHDLAEDFMERVVADAADDYGFSSVRLVYRVDDGPERDESYVPFTAGQKEFRLDTLWDTSGLELLPGSEITYYLEVSDNDAVSGPKAVRSPVRRIRFPTVGEIYAEVDEDHEREIENLSDIHDQQKDLRERLEKLNDELKQGKDVNWELRQDMENSVQRQENLEQQVEEAVQRLQETLDKASSRANMNQDLVQKMSEINELLSNLGNEELKRSFQELSKALDRMDKDAIRRALEEMQLTQDQMLRGLDRTIELLKQIRREEQVEDVVRRTDEIARLQEQITKELENLGAKEPEKSAEELQAEEAADQEAADQEAEAKEAAAKEAAAKEAAEKDPEGTPSEKAAESAEGEKAQDPSEEQASKSEEEAADPSQAGESKEGEKQEGEEGEKTEGSESGEKAEAGEEKEQVSPEVEAQIRKLEEEVRKELEKASRSSEQNQEQSSESSESQESQQGSPQDQKSPQGDNQKGQKSGSKKEQEKLSKLAEDQQSAEQMVEELKRMLEMLRKLNQDQPELSKSMEEMEQSKNMQGMKQNMKMAQQQMQSGNTQPSADYAFKAKEQADQLAQMARNMQSQMQSAQADRSIEMVERIIKGLIEVSGEQEVVVGSPVESRDLAKKQFDLVEATESIAESLQALARESFAIQNNQQNRIDVAIDKMDRATRLLEQGNRRLAVHQGRESASDLNETIVELMQSQAQMCQGQGSGNQSQQMMERMQGLSEGQQQLNEATRQMLERLSAEGRMSRTEEQRMAQLAAQQEMIRQGLQEVQQEFQQAKDMLGDMEQLSEEMKSVEQDLTTQNVDRPLVERQAQILSRLLDAQRSVRQREMSPQRESQTGTLAERRVPPPLPEHLLRRERTLEEDVLRGAEDRYPAQYRRLVEDYFRAVSRETRNP